MNDAEIREEIRKATSGSCLAPFLVGATVAAIVMLGPPVVRKVNDAVHRIEILEMEVQRLKAEK